jgi:outer membrane protein OmpA-like peptidoglycan-associated protein
MGSRVASKSSQSPHREGSAGHESVARSVAQPRPLLQVEQANSNQGVLRLLGSELIQRECACGGACPRCRGASETAGQVRLSQPGDPPEREAERVADQVMRMPDPGSRGEAGGSRSAPTGSRVGPAAPAASGEGRPLPESVRAYFEPRFGHDFGRVRLHDGPEAARLARSFAARALTVGPDVFFGRGQYAPEAADGRRRIAHELTHVVQQQAADRLAGPAGAAAEAPPRIGTLGSARRPMLQRQADLTKAPAGLPCNLAPDVAPPTGTKIDFAVGRSALTKVEQAKVDTFAAAWAAGDVLVAGFASTEGAQDLNWRLSCERAQSVAKRLMGQGVPAANIHIWAHGETTGFSAKSLPPNRRAVISKVAAPALAPAPAGKKAPPPAPSAAGPFGLWKISQTVTHGTVTKAGAGAAGYSSDVGITFSPEAKTVACDEIAFVQTVRSIDPVTKVANEPRANFKNRMTKTGWTLDRLDARKYGWYGYNNNGKPSGTVSPGASPKPLRDARLSDTPGWNVPNLIWDFETCAICKSGTQANQLYGSLTWGFDADAKNRLTKHRPMEFARPTTEFMDAVKQWNVQAKGPKAKRNAPDQVPLGPFK